MDENQSTTWVIDAREVILGRLASEAARLLMEGQKNKTDDRVIIVNARSAIVTGRRKTVVEDYRSKYALNHARKGPFFPRMPDRIVKRTVRGMLPYNKKPTGRSAYQNLRVEIDCPPHLISDLPDGHQRPTLHQKTLKKPDKYVSLDEICRVLGAPTNRWGA